MSLEEKIQEESEYYDEKLKEVEVEVIQLEKKLKDAEALLDQVLDEVELGENLLKKLKKLKEDVNGRD